MQDSKFNYYIKVKAQLMKPYQPGESLDSVSISQEDKENGSPKEGDMIAINEKNHEDKWLISKEFFEENYLGPIDPEKIKKLTEDLIDDNNDVKSLNHKDYFVNVTDPSYTTIVYE